MPIVGRQTPAYPPRSRAENSSSSPRPRERDWRESDPDAGKPEANIDQNDAWGYSAPLPKR